MRGGGIHHSDAFEAVLAIFYDLGGLHLLFGMSGSSAGTRARRLDYSANTGKGERSMPNLDPLSWTGLLRWLDFSVPSSASIAKQGRNECFGKQSTFWEMYFRYIALFHLSKDHCRLQIRGINTISE